MQSCSSSRRIQRFRTDHVEVATDWMGSRFGAHVRIPGGSGPLGYDITMAFLGHGAVGLRRVGLPNVLKAAAPAPMLHVALDGTRVEYRVGRRTLRATQDTAVLLAEGHEYSMRAPAGAMLSFVFDPGLLERQLQARGRGRPGARLLRSFEVPVPVAFVREVRGRLDASAAGREDPSSLAAALEGSIGAEDGIHAWIATRVLADAGVLATSSDSVRIAENIEAWIRHHCAEPITLERLTAVAGVSGRCLQKACIARWGRSPMELVTAARLQLARSRLASQSPDVSVTRAAVESGFTHLGRFAGLYRQVFGESPSDTLGR